MATSSFYTSKNKLKVLLPSRLTKSRTVDMRIFLHWAVFCIEYQKVFLPDIISEISLTLHSLWSNGKHFSRVFYDSVYQVKYRLEIFLLLSLILFTYFIFQIIILVDWSLGLILMYLYRDVLRTCATQNGCLVTLEMPFFFLTMWDLFVLVVLGSPCDVYV